MLMEFYDSRRFSHTDFRRKGKCRPHESWMCVKCLLKIQSSTVAAAETFCDASKSNQFLVYLFKLAEII